MFSRKENSLPLVKVGSFGKMKNPEKTASDSRVQKQNSRGTRKKDGQAARKNVKTRNLPSGEPWGWKRVGTGKEKKNHGKQRAKTEITGRGNPGPRC